MNEQQFMKEVDDEQGQDLEHMEWAAMQSLVRLYRAGYETDVLALASILGLSTQLEKELEYGHKRITEHQVSQEGRLPHAGGGNGKDGHKRERSPT